VWDHDGKVFNIFGVSKAPMIGWESVKSGYDDLFKRLPELSVEMSEPFIRQDGDSAVVIGVETQKVKLSSGAIGSCGSRYEITQKSRPTTMFRPVTSA
jgi:hypothetical protein